MFALLTFALVNFKLINFAYRRRASQKNDKTDEKKMKENKLGAMEENVSKAVLSFTCLKGIPPKKKQRKEHSHYTVLHEKLTSIHGKHMMRCRERKSVTKCKRTYSHRKKDRNEKIVLQWAALTLLM